MFFFFNSKKSYILSRRLYCVFLWNLLLLQIGVLLLVIWNCYSVVILHSMKSSLWSKLEVGCVGCSPSWRFLTAFLLVTIYWVYLPVLWLQLIFKISSNVAFWKTSFFKNYFLSFIVNRNIKSGKDVAKKNKGEELVPHFCSLGVISERGVISDNLPSQTTQQCCLIYDHL